MTYIPCSFCGGGVPGRPCTCPHVEIRMDAKTFFAIPDAKEDEIDRLRAENERLRGALAFYADPDNWRHMTEAEFWERHPGQDPSIAIRGGGVNIQAPAGRVLSAVDLDLHGHRARAALDGDGAGDGET